MRDPPLQFQNLIGKYLVNRPLSKQHLRDSSARITGAQLDVQGSGPREQTGDEPVARNSPKPESAKNLLSGKPQEIIDLFTKLDERLTALGDDVQKHYRKYYVAYKVRRSFASVEIQNRKLLMFANVPFPEAPMLPGAQVRDVTNIGHFGTGHVELTIRGPEDLPFAETLAASSYARTAK